MKTLTLKALTLKNFKGVKDFTLSPDGQDFTLYGNNGSGKSTCADAYAWLLTDSDSQDNGKFQIKEFDAAGKVKQNAIHSVEGVFDIDDEDLTLRKEYREVFVGKGISKVFDGNKTLRFINELSVSRQAYQTKLEEFAPKNVFKTLLNPAYFSAQKTDEKRALILALVDDVTQEDVISSDKMLASLPGITKSLSIEDYKSVAQKQKTKLKKQRDEIPIRIDEILQNQPNIKGLEEKEILRNIKIWEKKQTSAETEKIQIENGGDLAAKTQELAKIRTQKIDAENVFSTAKNKGILQENETKNETTLEINKLENTLQEWTAIIQKNKELLSGVDKEILELRAEWQGIKNKKYTTPPEVCPECGQKIPADQYEAAHKKGLEKFNTAKAFNLKTITETGKRMAGERAKADLLIKQAQEEVAKKKEEISNKAADLSAILDIIETVTKQKLETKEYKDILALEIDCIKKIEAAKAGDTGTQVKTLTNKIEAFKNNITGLKNSLAKIQTVKKNETRIKELGEEQKQLSKEFETLEKSINLADLYTKTWVEMVEKPVNALFEITDFQMFEEMVNGGIKNACVAMFEGVPYGMGLNKGHSKMIGLDIIKTFSKYYDVALPIFVDDMEGVTLLPEMETQIIKLIKPEITDENMEYYSTLQTKPFNKN